MAKIGHIIRVHPNGSIDTLYTDLIDLGKLGKMDVSRASHIEFNNETQVWEVTDAETGEIVDYAPTRETALIFEHEYYMALLSMN